MTSFKKNVGVTTAKPLLVDWAKHGEKSNANVGEIYKYINQHTISTLHICDQYRSWTPDQMLSSETDIASINPTLAISRANRFNRIGNGMKTLHWMDIEDVWHEIIGKHEWTELKWHNYGHGQLAETSHWTIFKRLRIISWSFIYSTITQKAKDKFIGTQNNDREKTAQ